jgi:hypothetical protein
LEKNGKLDGTLDVGGKYTPNQFLSNRNNELDVFLQTNHFLGESGSMDAINQN